MKKRFSKILCTLLAFMMILTSMPLSSLAALVTGETQTVKFRILYVDSSFNIGYSYGDSWSSTYTCADTTRHSDSAYSNHSIRCSDIKSKGINAAVNKLNSTGWEVKGWNKGSTGSANPTIYTTYSGTTVTNASTYIHIVAKKSAVTYNLSYNTNGGSNAPSSQSQQSATGSVTFTVANTTPVKAGYRFLGWSTSSNATSPSFYAGSPFYTTSQYNTLYAVWTPDTKYTVTYKDGVNGTVFTDKIYTDILSGSSTPSFGTVPTRPNYVFAGWSPSVASTVTQNVIYTAIWVPITYTVTYTDGIDGEDVFKDQVYTMNSGDKTPAFNGTPTRPNYVFTGWSPAVADTVTGNVIYTANWSEDKNNNGIPDKDETHKVIFKDGVDGEIFGDKEFEVFPWEKDPDNIDIPLRPGFNFTGWTTSTDKDGNITHTATWEKIPEDNTTTPTDPTDPTDPTGPTDPSDPTEPTEPINPGNPGNNTNNNNSSTPSEDNNSNNDTSQNTSSNKYQASSSNSTEKNTNSKADTNNDSNAAKTGNVSSTSPKTGAQPEIVLWFALALIAVMCVAIAPVIRRKKNKDKSC